MKILSKHWAACLPEYPGSHRSLSCCFFCCFFCFGVGPHLLFLRCPLLPFGANVATGEISFTPTIIISNAGWPGHPAFRLVIMFCLMPTLSSFQFFSHSLVFPARPIDYYSVGAFWTPNSTILRLRLYSRCLSEADRRTDHNSKSRYEQCWPLVVDVSLALVSG